MTVLSDDFLIMINPTVLDLQMANDPYPFPPPPQKIKKLRINGNFIGQVKIASYALVTLVKERVPEIKPSDNLYAKLDQILFMFHREIQENL